MIAAFLATFLFAMSAICGHRSSRQIGGAEANFWCITLAAIFLALWANLFGTGLAAVATGVAASFAGPVGAWAVAGAGLFVLIVGRSVALAWQQRQA